MSVKCGECQQNCKLVGGKKIYPHRKDLYNLRFYKCPDCGAYAGCHGDSTRPKGVPANKATRDARMRTHALFDPLWKGKKEIRRFASRKAAYKAMAADLGMSSSEAHIGMMDVSKLHRVRSWALRQTVTPKETA